MLVAGHSITGCCLTQQWAPPELRLLQGFTSTLPQSALPQLKHLAPRIRSAESQLHKPRAPFLYLISSHGRRPQSSWLPPCARAAARKKVEERPLSSAEQQFKAINPMICMKGADMAPKLRAWSGRLQSRQLCHLQFSSPCLPSCRQSKLKCQQPNPI